MPISSGRHNKTLSNKKPELQASKGLLSLAYLLCHTDKESFVRAFNEWIDRWSAFLKERSVDPKTGKSHYIHRRVRSAYLSLKRNMTYLWTWYDNPCQGIPNTNNGLEGQFADLKSKLRNHNGILKRHRMGILKRPIGHNLPHMASYDRYLIT